jgi:prepilin-type N-terminal cleavage/methylation domain-containing protein
MKIIMISARDKKGFTLMELLVAIAIFGILSTFMVANFSRNEQAKELKQQAEILVAGLQKVQNMALAGTLVSDKSPLYYRLVLWNCQSNCSYNLWASFSSSPQIQIESILLNKINVEIKKTIPLPVPNTLAVIFYPSRGNMRIDTAWMGGRNWDEVMIELTHVQNSVLKYCVTINSISGRIDLVSGACPP